MFKPYTKTTITHIIESYDNEAITEGTIAFKEKINDEIPSSPPSSDKQDFRIAFLSLCVGTLNVVMGQAGKPPALVQLTSWEAVDAVFGQRPGRVHR